MVENTVAKPETTPAQPTDNKAITTPAAPKDNKPEATPAAPADNKPETPAAPKDKKPAPPPDPNIKKSHLGLWLILAVILLLVGLGVWWIFRPAELPVSIVKGNGRIEATEIDIATKTPGRIVEILAKEGDIVKAGAIMARMDTAVLLAQQAEAQAQVKHADSAHQTAKAIVTQRESERNAAQAVVAQHQAELAAASKRFQRSLRLVGEGAMPEQDVDDNRARVQGIQAAISAAQAQVAAAFAGIVAAKSQVVEMQSLIAAAQASVTRLQADIDDSVLIAPRDGRVQYRVAEPGEVLAAGGRVLNMVDLSDVYMTFFLPTAAVGKVSYGSEIRLVFDALPDNVIPATASYVASVAQFTPKTVETESERLKLMFRVRARIAPELLQQHLAQVKTGVPGVAYVNLDPSIAWPAKLAIKLPQ